MLPILKEPVHFLLGPYLMWAASNIKQEDWTDRELLGRGGLCGDWLEGCMGFSSNYFMK